MEPAVNAPVIREAIERPDMASSTSGLRVVQITSDNRFTYSHIYMESRVFTPDSSRFVFQRLLDPDASDQRMMMRQLMLCDVMEGCAVRQITDEAGVKGPSVSPDGRYVYYLVDQSSEGWWAVKRADLTTLERETVLHVDRALPGTSHPLKRLYVLSSISSDGERLCLSGYLGDGKTRNAPWGLVVVDLSQATAKVVLEGPDYSNMHPQYCRSRDATASHDILVQHNHGCEVDEQGFVISNRTDKDPLGPDIHVVRDDGSHFRSLPWGRDGVEFSQGHQAWRGEQLSVVTSLHRGRLRTGSAGEGSSDEIFPLLEGWPMVTEPEFQHAGKRMPGADRNRNDISRTLARPNACHFAFDPSGTKLISDTYGYRGRGATCEIYLGVLPATPDAALRTRHLLYPKTSFGRGQHTHPHPFLSPDATRAFFNSDEPGVPHIWMVEGIEFPEM